MKKSQMNTFEIRNNKLHWDIMIEFVEFVQKNSTADSDEKEELADCLLFLKNVVLPSEAQQKEGIDAWITNMHEPLDCKKVKYAKAVDRILSSTNPPGHAMIYHAFSYRDLKAAYECSNSTALQRLNLLAHNKDWSDEAKPKTLEAMWSDLGLDPWARAHVRDLSEGKDLGVFRGSFEAPVNPHGAKMFRVTPIEGASLPLKHFNVKNVWS